ncbi:MAG: shikimate kinase [Chloroflexi bacterium]|nr:shikimate kinase [Chloroflexota bacterium]
MTDVESMPRCARIVLLGMMGSGKSSIGRALADRTGWPFVDNDALVLRATGRTAREILAAEGEAALREAESDALRAGASVDGPAIVATAAGTVLDPADRAVIHGSGFVVWLTAPAEVLAGRAVGAAHRPWLDEDPVGWFRAALEERASLYGEIADLEIDTNAMDPAEGADAILRACSAVAPATIES